MGAWSLFLLSYTFEFTFYTMVRRRAMIWIGVVNLNLEKKVALWWGKAVFEYRGSASL